jgi:integrase
MTAMKLDAKTVASLTLPAGKRDRIWFDDTLKGFGFRLRGGRASWVIQYRHGGAHRRYRIADASVLGADQARAEARKLLARLALGSDPALERGDRRAKDTLTLRGIVDEFLATKTAMRRTSLQSLERFLRGTYFRPLLGMPVDRIHRRDVATRLTAIAREHGSTSAGKARGALIQCLAWAMMAGLCEVNPAADTPSPAAARPRERVLSDAELAAVWDATGPEAGPGGQALWLDHSRIVRLLVLCGARRGEIGGICRSEIDEEAGLWILPAARSKNGRALTLPVMPMMAEVLAGIPRRVGRDHLFGSHGAGGFADWTKAKRALDARSGVADWTIHDLRRTVATRMGDLGVGPHIIEAVLNHQSGAKRGVAGTYNRSPYAREMRAALGLWHDHLRTIVNGGERRVLPFAPERA